MTFFVNWCWQAVNTFFGCLLCFERKCIDLIQLASKIPEEWLWEQSSGTMIIVNYDLAPLHDQANFPECQYLHPAIVGTAMGKLPRRATLFCISSPDCDVKIGRLLWIAPSKLGPAKVKQDSLSENVPFKWLKSVYLYPNLHKCLCAVNLAIISCAEYQQI